MDTDLLDGLSNPIITSDSQEYTVLDIHLSWKLKNMASRIEPTSDKSLPHLASLTPVYQKTLYIPTQRPATSLKWSNWASTSTLGPASKPIKPSKLGISEQSNCGHYSTFYIHRWLPPPRGCLNWVVPSHHPASPHPTQTEELHNMILVSQFLSKYEAALLLWSNN